MLIAGIRICAVFLNYRESVQLVLRRGIQGGGRRFIRRSTSRGYPLTGGRCLSCLHHGPYETLSESYGLIFDHSKSIGMKINYPIREIYIKGPGMIFRGNPKKYITEIQFPFED